VRRVDLPNGDSACSYPVPKPDHRNLLLEGARPHPLLLLTSRSEPCAEPVAWKSALAFPGALVVTRRPCGASLRQPNDRRIMSPLLCGSRESGSVLTWANEPARHPPDPGELQPELQPRRSAGWRQGTSRRTGHWDDRMGRVPPQRGLAGRPGASASQLPARSGPPTAGSARPHGRGAHSPHAQTDLTASSRAGWVRQVPKRRCGAGRRARRPARRRPSARGTGRSHRLGSRRSRTHASPAMNATSLAPSKATSPKQPRASARRVGRSRPTISASMSSGLVSHRCRSCPVAARNVSAAATATKTTVARRATGSSMTACSSLSVSRHRRPARTHLTLSARPVAMPTIVMNATPGWHRCATGPATATVSPVRHAFLCPGTPGSPGPRPS